MAIFRTGHPLECLIDIHAVNMLQCKEINLFESSVGGGFEGHDEKLETRNRRIFCKITLTELCNLILFCNS